MSELPEKIPLFILDSNESTSLFITHYIKWVVDLPSLPSFQWDFFIIDSPKGEDLILVYDLLYHFNPIIDWKKGFITYYSCGITSSTSNDFATAVNSVALVGEIKTPLLPPSVHIPSIIPSSDQVFKEIKDFGEYVATSLLHISQEDMDLPPSSFCASLEEEWEEEEEPEEIETVLKVVPPSYHQYLDVFSKIKAEKIPPHGTCDHYIELEGLLPPKKDGVLHLCVDYRKLNAVTRKNRYPVPPMNHLLTVFNSSTILSKIDLHGAYNLWRIKEGHEQLTALRTKYGGYESLVMPFGLTNAPASFQNLVNDIFSDFLDIFVVVYLDDIMVFSSSEEEHVKHVVSALQRLRDNNLFAKASKSPVYSSKAQEILHWPQPKNIKALQSFLGFSNFYCCLIENYSKEISALTSLAKKYSPLIFNEEALSQFQILKEAFTTAPILSHFNPSLSTIVETDASEFALGAVLSQLNDSGKHPIAFDSCKLLPAELHYEIHDKELLGIVWALKSWRAFLLSLSDSFEVLTDHSSLQYFMSSKVLTHHQAFWVEFLSAFHFSITYRPGRLATLPDSLSFDQIQKEVWQDIYYKAIHKKLERGESVSDYTLEPQARLLLLKDRVVIPRNHELQLDILQKRHDSPLAGHLGQEKTLKLIKRDFYWAAMNQIIKDYVSSCKQCSRNKNINNKKLGLLKPLQILSGPWNSL
ncbi:hypothetical protein O181_030439 [Austropuccinia psidii MF-1]|uniref:Reverse transcriptase domain-containing protein n=1 Tax=Austropuccinia psidii MF-1 TaxID=1389203 RepID=A0A9Q3CSW9_9BASI|nr:hypothetical protein [Austropuccinia psidii MF-1]